jgi:hypothetical protein
MTRVLVSSGDEYKDLTLLFSALLAVVVIGPLLEGVVTLWMGHKHELQKMTARVGILYESYKDRFCWYAYHPPDTFNMRIRVCAPVCMHVRAPEPLILFSEFTCPLSWSASHQNPSL